MAYSLRLPALLDVAARDRADYLGISLNALVCVALDAYLRGSPERIESPTSSPGGLQSPSKTSRQNDDQGEEPQGHQDQPEQPEQPSGSGQAPKLTRAEKKRLHELRKKQFR